MTAVLRKVSLVAVLAALALAACTNAPPPPATPGGSPQVYPSPDVPTTSYPPTATGPTATPNCTVPAFTFDQHPLLAGTTTVTGSGPADVPITIDSITYMGRSLGTGTIGKDGRFSVGVTALLANDYVGIRLGDLTGTSFRNDAFLNEPCYRGPFATLIPQVGFFFDTAQIK